MVKATRLALYLVVLILAFGTCELLLRMAGAVSLHTHRLLLAPWENASITIWRDGVGLRGNPDHHDEAGYRDGSRPTQAEIVVLDDSHAYGAGVESWPRRLAHFSARRVQNMARPAAEPGHFLASLTRRSA